jgi:flagellar biosynthesis protein FlhF
MKSKTFRAETMIEVLAQVQKDLGADALVVTARQIPGGEPWQVWRKPLVEVVAVKLEPGEEAPKTSSGSDKPAQPMKPDLSNKDAGALKHTKSTPSTPRPAAQPVGSSARVSPASATTPAENNHQQEDSEPVGDAVKEDVVEIKGKKVRSQPAREPRLDLLHQLGQNETLEDVRIIQVPTSGIKPPELSSRVPSKLTVELPKPVTQPVEGAWPELIKVYHHLLNQGVDSGLANRVCQISADTLGVQTAMDQKKLEAYIRRQLEASIKVQLETSRNEGKVIFLVGPSGAGKTSFAAKLAARYRKEMQKSVAWVCADTVRTGGIAEARAFTEAINIPMQVAYSPHECASIVQSLSGTGLVIVDTPAANPRNEESMVETGALLTSIPNRITWLVVPATAKESDLVNTAAAFAVFKPGALVVTKMDETNSYGGVYNLAMRTQLPLVYFCSGPRILDDLHAAAASRLVQSLFTERFGQ